MSKLDYPDPEAANWSRRKPSRDRTCVPNDLGGWCATATGKRPGEWAMNVKTRCGAKLTNITRYRESRVCVPTCKACNR